MILIIGGMGQGKLDYMLQKTGYGPAQIARTPEEVQTRLVFAGLEDWSKPGEITLLGADSGAVLICDEVGCDVVPMELAQRTRRKAVSRFYYRLAARTERMKHIFCGLPIVLRGKGP